MPASRPEPGDVAAALREIVAEHGPQALSKPTVISNLMKDVLPDDSRMARVVIAAAEERIGDQLRDLIAQGVDAATATRLAAARLAEATMFPSEACAWATGEIAIALGVLAGAAGTAIVVPSHRAPAPPGDLARRRPDETLMAPRAGADAVSPVGSPAALAPQDAAAREILARTFALSANYRDGTVTMIDLATGSASPPIRVGRRPKAIAITPDGAMALVANNGDGTVTLIRTRTASAVARITVGKGPQAIAVAPDGTTAYVANHDDGTITPISLPAGRPSAPIKACHGPRAITVDPAGMTAYVVSGTRDTITAISLVTGRAGRPVKVGNWAYAIATAPDGTTAYVASHSGITPIDLATGLQGPSIPVSGYHAIALTPDGSTAYLTRDNGTITPLDLATGKLGAPIMVGPSPHAIAITPDGATAYVATRAGHGTLTPITLANRKPGVPIKLGADAAALAIAAVIPSGSTRA